MEVKHIVNIVGNTYGKWTIMRKSDKRKNGVVMVVARCVCGIEKEMSKSNFLNGFNSQQCFSCNLKEQKKKKFCYYAD